MSTPSPGELILQERRRRGWSKARLCQEIQAWEYKHGNGDHLGLNPNYVREWESGKRSVSDYYAPKLSAVLGIPIEVFIDRRSAAGGESKHERVRQPVADSAEGLGQVIPAELPPDIADFTGRSDEVAELYRRLLNADRAEATVIVTVSGPPGVGKSALAVHVAHELCDEFPDGQLFVDLRGDEGEGLDPAVVLSQLLHALGVSSEEIPPSLDAAARAYRSRLAGKRVLVMLDNALSEAQVRPLLPGDATCATLVTSRSPLSGLAGATSLTLGLFSERDAVSLLARVTGDEQVANSASASTVAARCGFLPLALRIAGARLRSRRSWTVETLAAQLDDERQRLKRLTAGDLAVRPSLTLSYRGLGPAEVKAFRLLGLLNMPEVSVDLAAALTGAGWEETEEVLERLVDAALLEAPAPNRYRFHDLVRLFALERAEAEEVPEVRHAAIAAAVAWYVDRAVEGAVLLGPSRTAGAGGFFPDLAVALRWFETERENLVRAVARADEYNLGPACWKLADALFRFFELRRYLPDWQQVNERALSAARRAGERGIEGQFLNGLGCALREQGRFDEAIGCLERALTVRRDDGHRAGEGRTLKNLGDTYIDLRQPKRAFDSYEEALEIGREVGDRAREGQAQFGVGVSLLGLGEYAAAEAQLRGALAVLREVGDRPKEGRALLRLADTQRAQRRLVEAVASYTASLAIMRETGDRYNEGLALWHLGLTLQDQDDEAGQPAEACWHQALAIFNELGATAEAEDIRQLLATAPQKRDTQEGTHPAA